MLKIIREILLKIVKYYAVDTYYTDEILEELELIGCS